MTGHMTGQPFNSVNLLVKSWSSQCFQYLTLLATDWLKYAVVELHYNLFRVSEVRAGGGAAPAAGAALAPARSHHPTAADPASAAVGVGVTAARSARLRKINR